MAKIEIKGVSKYYGKTCALKDVSVTFEENKIYGLLGRNGAGKTTLLRLITNRIFLDKGEILIDGENITENDNAIGKIAMMSEEKLIPENMKISDYYKWYKEFYPKFDMDYAMDLSKRFGVKVNKTSNEMSTGYTSIYKVIAVLASGAEILVFDEPVLGLDANHRELFYKMVVEGYIKEPKTIILATHIIEEVSELLESVVILKDNKVITNNEVEEMLDKVYTISGLSINVDEFIKDKICLNTEAMATFKAVTIEGELTEDDRKKIKELSLELSKVELQKLFIYLTGEEAL